MQISLTFSKRSFYKIIRLVLNVGLNLALISGCNSHLATYASSPLPETIQPASTSVPIASASKLLEAVETTPSNPPPPSAIPSSWLIYNSIPLHLEFRYPANWLAESATRYSGPDGYFELSLRPYPASEFDSLITLCVLGGNENKPAAFGMFPMVSTWQGASSPESEVAGYGCTINPSPDSARPAESQAILYARYPQPWSQDNLLVLRTDSAHFDGILSTLSFTGSVTATPHPINIYDAPACAIPLKDSQPVVSTANGLKITEYPIVNSGCDPWAHFDGFQARVRALNLDAPGWYDLDRQHRAEAANELLLSFGYRLERRSYQLSKLPGSTAPDQILVFDLYKGSERLVSNITQIGPVSVKATGDDFILWVQDTFNSQPPIEVRLNSLRILDWWESGFNTAWIGTALVRFDYDSSHLFPVGAASQAHVYRDDEPIFTFTIPQPGPAGNPIQWLWAWQDHWVMEAGNVVVQDGILQNPLLGYEEMFDWHLVNGQPFFLFSKAGSYGLSYADEAAPVYYKDIIHGLLCCEPSVYAVKSNTKGAWFFALRNGIWYLVSALVK
jgi:hypothetical protein